MAELPDIAAIRNLAAQIREHTLDHLDHYLEQFKANCTKHGGTVHFASDPAGARDIIAKVASQTGCHRAIRAGSSMIQEVGLMAGQARGMELIEFPPAGPRRADMGLVDAGFLVAETGEACVLGSNRDAIPAGTRVTVMLAGIERLVPRLADLGVLLKLFSRSSGEAMVEYASLLGGNRPAGETNGAEELHVILLDNGRSEILAGAYRDALRCIGCEACAIACPVYRTAGREAYASVYAGPIGAVISPLLGGLAPYRELPQASSLCGACYEVCPVKIDIPSHLIRLRRDLAAARLTGWRKRLWHRAWTWCCHSAFRYRTASALYRFALRRRADGTGWVRKLPRWAAGWTEVRDMPAPAAKSFRQIWRA